MTKDFLKGVGTVIELFPLQKDEGKLSLPQHSDEEAIYNDWQEVGADMRRAAEYLSDKQE